MTEYVKIRCDDCKFVENCVDYGWKDCKKFTQKPSESMTNEEYLRSCTTEQLAEFVLKSMLFYDNAGITFLEAIKQAIKTDEKLSDYFMENVIEWLKQPHT